MNHHTAIDTDRLPLIGLRILDLTRLLPGAFCTLLLADLGAEVIKVEAPSGDPMRGIAPAGFAALNRNKQGVVIDLKSDQGPGQLLHLVEDADVLIESFRPGVLDRLGVSVDVLRAANPALIVCSLSGYGQDGPLAQQAGHDINYMALAGMLAGTSHPPVVQMADLGGAWSAACAILASLIRRAETGQGAYIDASLFDAALSAGMLLRAQSAARGAPPHLPDEMLSGGLACYHVYATADGRAMALGALERKFFAAFCHVINRPGLIDVQYDRQRQDWLRAELQTVFSAKTQAQWIVVLDEADADTCCTPVLDMFEAAETPAVQSRGMLSKNPDGVAHTRLAPNFAGVEPPPISPAPSLNPPEDSTLDSTE